MSKAEELAKWLERGYPSPTEKNIAAHLRALDASHQRLKEALEGLGKWSDSSRGTFRFSADEDSDSVQRIYAALEQAKALS